MPRPVDARDKQLIEAPCREVLLGAISPMDDAARERARSTFDSNELAAFLHDGEDKLQRRCGVGHRLMAERRKAATTAAASSHSPAPWFLALA